MLTLDHAALVATQSTHHPTVGGTYLGRMLSSVSHAGALWTAVQVDRDGQNLIGMMIAHGKEARRFLIPCEGQAHQPFVCADPVRGVAVVWNEATRSGWAIRRARFDEDTGDMAIVDTVYLDGEICLPPSAAFHDGALWTAWSALSGDSLRILLAREDDGWTMMDILSPPDIDSFRPVLASTPHGLAVAWDEYRQGRYEIRVVLVDGGDSSAMARLAGDAQRWMRPRLAVLPDGRMFVLATVLQMVGDDYGVLDHWPFGAVAQVTESGAKLLLDRENADDPRIIADLRKGLLASADDLYQGYNGLRRNPCLTVSDAGQLWCIWESRQENNASKIGGNLIARKLQADDTWSQPEVVYDARYAYAVPPSFDGPDLPIAFLRYEESGLDVLGSDTVSLERREPYVVDPARWSRWRITQIEPESRPNSRTHADGIEYSLYWADTHCHSIFSPDAEGEVDELIHMGRDVALLDAVCVIDNDCYPHKALSEAEWRVHQGLSSHFTREGRFVVFPGWEYTFHRDDLEPDFNHRVIMYPRAGGTLVRRIDKEGARDVSLMASLRGTGALAYPHHCTYRIIDPAIDRNVEVVSSWRVCLEETDFTVKSLQAGDRFGFVGSSDSHRAMAGLGGALTGLYATELTPEALFDAYRHRRTIATQGFFAWMEVRAAGVFIGGEGRIEGPPELEATLRMPREIEFVDVLRDGIPVQRIAPGAASVEFSFLDRHVTTGDHFYLVRCKLVGDPSYNMDPDVNSYRAFGRDGPYGDNLARARGVFAWSSPIWLAVT